MKTQTLLMALTIAKPSLGRPDSTQAILTHFCFADDMVYAFDQVTAVILEEKTGLNCALHGDTLIGLLEASGAEDVKIKEGKGGGVVELNLGRGWVKVPSLPLDSSNFQLPDEKPAVVVALNDAMIAGIRCVLTAAPDDSLKPEYAGLTFSLDKEGLALFATDNKSAARWLAPVGHKGKAFNAVLPKQACEQIVKLSILGEGKGTLEIGPSAAIARMGNVTLVSQVLPAKLENYLRVFADHAPSKFEALPEGLAFEIAMAQVLLAREAVKELAIAFGANNVKISASGAAGAMTSNLPAKRKGDAAVVCNPDLISRILPDISGWACNDGRSLVFDGGKNFPFTYIVSAQAAAKEAT